MSLVPFDDRDGQIWHDGKLVPWREAKIHVLTHALHYASCVFEGERVYNGKVFKLAEHSQRLIDSANVLGFELPWSRAEIEAATNAVVKANGIADGYVRPVAWRGAEQMGVAAQQTKIHMAIATWQWPAYFSPEARMRGIRLAMAKYARPAPNTAPTKSKAAGLYMICTISKHAAEAEGYDDALMLDWRGQVAEATGANVFFIRGDELHTPTPDCFLDGITRRTVIGLAGRRGLKVVERTILPDELASFSECFVVGTAAEVTPVAEIAEHRYKPGKICETLINDYTAAVQPRQHAAE
ncbi:MAG TPA: branched-chain amino acid aminotransferase [Hyphomicrobiaceae bacterium]